MAVYAERTARDLFPTPARPEICERPDGNAEVTSSNEPLSAENKLM